jgi:hypothetical protein
VSDAEASALMVLVPPFINAGEKIRGPKKFEGTEVFSLLHYDKLGRFFVKFREIFATRHSFFSQVI